ncbi:hypothetical protein B0H10DRAFT_2034748 [Mycena sp. CBHHK59/15]|nr:hypothetical protein B0H10DRAFT_2034748 [Mycena sp. CBHHK59/15]
MLRPKAPVARLFSRPCPRPLRPFHGTPRQRDELYDPEKEERMEEEVDVCIVGGGPAGLSAAIRLKQLEKETGKEVRVVLLEKGGEVGSHILSGAVIEPTTLDVLLPDWRTMDHPLSQPVTSSGMRLFTPKRDFPIPHPPQMSNKGNYIASLSRVVAWLGSIAEDLGVEIYPGFAGTSLLLSPNVDATDAIGRPTRSVHGVITHDAGLTRARTKKVSFEPGMAFHAHTTLLAEGAHGSLSKQAIAKYSLRHASEPQTYGIGVKEVWRVDPKLHIPGKVVHTLGWPLGWQTYGGGWVYHMHDGLVSIGLVVGLDYKNPYLEPYREFQRMKHHPYFRALLASSPSTERLAYGARALTEGGLQSLPQLHFPGGALIGCAAGVVNTAKIKGVHNAMRTGMLAAESAFAAIHPSTPNSSSPPEYADMEPYSRAFAASPVHADLWGVRNLRPSFNGRLGVPGGVLYSGVDSILGGRVPWTLSHGHGKGVAHATTSPDALATLPAASCTPIGYPTFEPPLSTDLMTSIALTGTNHAEGQPVHLRVMPAGGEAETPARRREHVRVNVSTYAGLLGRACPAGVYEYVDDDGGRSVPGNAAGADGEDEGWEGKKLVINSQNCIHCKLCDIKVPTQDITWTVPEGGGGPKYTLT